jgi:hypothetical protein
MQISQIRRPRRSNFLQLLTILLQRGCEQRKAENRLTAEQNNNRAKFEGRSAGERDARASTYYSKQRLSTAPMLPSIITLADLPI